MSSNPQGLPERTFYHKALPVLNKLLHGSAPFISTFLLIHLSAPALANLGGSSIASSTLLLGREYYQTEFGEKYLVLAPIAVHALSGIVKRVLSPAKTPPRPWRSLLSLTGFANIIFFLPHFMTHRAHPMNPAPPIFAVGPSELDFEFVKYGLSNWPWRSWLLYGGLVASVVLHAVDGERLIFNTYFGETMGRIKAAARKNLLTIGVGLVAVPVLTGVFVMSREPLMVLPSTAERFHASFTLSPLFRT
ncbi:hypothetical protein MSAN_00410900 [Mycena sanguinolenta]|uniref:Mitochondrial adapter protein MCP1 transmembrane domain-containing protein n=1 Tax=Mycena sanguinolenta TaxID=230812 RepID=A0A8H6Z9Z8_9AGAR|nr:hypothetical protein MSAN_00410900 [Mycena sanguinolenta]